MTSPLFTWDEDKNHSNQRKHGLSFEVAVRVFFDPLHHSVQDRIEDGEHRWQTIWQIGGLTAVLVAHTLTEEGSTDEPVELIRIISARPATRRERTRMKTVRYSRDTLPPLTEAQKDNLKRLAAMPDDKIDTSDIPELTDAQFAEMRAARALPSGQEADHGPSGRRCSGLAQSGKQELPLPH